MTDINATQWASSLGVRGREHSYVMSMRTPILVGLGPAAEYYVLSQSSNTIYFYNTL